MSAEDGRTIGTAHQDSIAQGEDLIKIPEALRPGWKSLTTHPREAAQVFSGERTRIGRPKKEVQEHEELDQVLAGGWMREGNPFVQGYFVEDVYGDTETQHVVRAAITIIVNPDTSDEKLQEVIGSLPSELSDIPVLSMRTGRGMASGATDARPVLPNVLTFRNQITDGRTHPALTLHPFDETLPVELFTGAPASQAA